MTGSYHNHFRIFNRETAENVTLEASRDAIEGPTHVLTPIQVFSGPQRRHARHELHVDNIDYQLKIMHSAWHPTRPVLALAAVNNLYLFRQ